MAITAEYMCSGKNVKEAREERMSHANVDDGLGPLSPSQGYTSIQQAERPPFAAYTFRLSCNYVYIRLLIILELDCWPNISIC